MFIILCSRLCPTSNQFQQGGKQPSAQLKQAELWDWCTKRLDEKGAHNIKQKRNANTHETQTRKVKNLVVMLV